MAGSSQGRGGGKAGNVPPRPGGSRPTGAQAAGRGPAGHLFRPPRGTARAPGVGPPEPAAAPATQHLHGHRRDRRRRRGGRRDNHRQPDRGREQDAPPPTARSPRGRSPCPPTSSPRSRTCPSTSWWRGRTKGRLPDSRPWRRPRPCRPRTLLFTVGRQARDRVRRGRILPLLRRRTLGVGHGPVEVRYVHRPAGDDVIGHRHQPQHPHVLLLRVHVTPASTSVS